MLFDYYYSGSVWGNMNTHPTMNTHQYKQPVQCLLCCPDILRLYNHKKFVHRTDAHSMRLILHSWGLCTRLEDPQPHTMQLCCFSLMCCLGCHSSLILKVSAALFNELCAHHLLPEPVDYDCFKLLRFLFFFWTKQSWCVKCSLISNSL